MINFTDTREGKAWATESAEFLAAHGDQLLTAIDAAADVFRRSVVAAQACHVTPDGWTQDQVKAWETIYAKLETIMSKEPLA